VTTYTAIANNEIDEDSEITTGLMTKIRDNPIAITEGASGAPKIQTAALEQTGGSEAVTTATIRAGAVTQTEIASAAVGQGELKTLTQDATYTGSVSGSTTQYDYFTLTSPKYTTGFEIRGYTSDPVAAAVGLQNADSSTSAHQTGTSSSYSSFSRHMQAMRYNNQGGSRTLSIDADITYVTSSPPYDLGDGEIPLFIFILLDSSNNPCGVITDKTPPWVYNGPTRANPDFYDKGVGYYAKKTINETTGEIDSEIIEITQSVKNADMNIIPHPFVTRNQVVLLDPVSTLEIMEIRDTGERISALIFGDYLRLDNAPINRAAPQGVTTSAYKWKDTQRKAGAMIKDRRLKQGPYAPGVIDG